jgi:crotonobetainyl-CoA:carnitine CoA-transferase CaiB-like acyl-CoA transferase
LEEVLQERYFREREMVVDLRDKHGGRTTLFGTPIKLSVTPGSLRTPAPGFGENTRDILSELGYSTAEIDALVEKGIV